MQTVQNCGNFQKFLFDILVIHFFVLFFVNSTNDKEIYLFESNNTEFGKILSEFITSVLNSTKDTIHSSMDEYMDLLRLITDADKSECSQNFKKMNSSIKFNFSRDSYNHYIFFNQALYDRLISLEKTFLSKKNVKKSKIIIIIVILGLLLALKLHELAHLKRNSDYDPYTNETGEFDVDEAGLLTLLRILLHQLELLHEFSLKSGAIIYPLVSAKGYGTKISLNALKKALYKLEETPDAREPQWMNNKMLNHFLYVVHTAKSEEMHGIENAIFIDISDMWSKIKSALDCIIESKPNKLSKLSLHLNFGVFSETEGEKVFLQLTEQETSKNGDETVSHYSRNKRNRTVQSVERRWSEWGEE